jgi:predicted porin
MNNTFKYALGAVLSLGLVAGAAAQENFPDVPDNHWAFEALARMKREGLLMGYPDGLWRGNRPATRYEMAVAIHATYVHLKGITEDLQRQIDALKGAGGDDGPMKAALEALRRDVDGMKGWGDSINSLQKMASTFEKELAAMGVDVESMKKDIASLNDRVTKLEKNALPITVHGDLNLYVETGFGTSKRLGIRTDARLVGNDPGNATRAAGILDGTSVFHDAFLKIAGTNEEGPKWDAVLQVGNMLNGTTNTPSNTGGNANDGANTEIIFRRFAVEFDHGMLGQAMNVKIGRQGYKIAPYIFMAPDTDPYYSSPFDNGEQTLDGAVLGFNFGAAKLNVVFGRTNNRDGSAGTDVSNVRVGNITAGRGAGFGQVAGGLGGGVIAADTTLGAHLNVPIGEKGGVDLAYLVHSQNTPNVGGGNPDNVHVWGGNLNYDMNGIKLNAGYAQSNIYSGKKSVVTRNNFAWNVGGAYETDKWGIMAGYREIQPHFGAAGDWGRIGTWWNPTDVKGFHVGGHINLSEQLTFNAKAEFLTGLGKRYNVPGFGNNIEGLRTGDRFDSYSFGLDYKIAEGWNAMLGAEFVDFKIDGVNAKPRQRWYNIGFGYSLSDAAKLSLLWQISDADDKNTGLWGNQRFTGNLITTQLSVKF